MFTGTGIITNPFSSYYPVQVQTKMYFNIFLNSNKDLLGEKKDIPEKIMEINDHTLMLDFGIIQGDRPLLAVASNATVENTDI